MANGQDLKKIIDQLPSIPEVVCVQKIGLKPNVDFRIFNLLLGVIGSRGYWRVCYIYQGEYVIQSGM